RPKPLRLVHPEDHLLQLHLTLTSIAFRKIMAHRKDAARQPGLRERLHGFVPVTYDLVIRHRSRVTRLPIKKIQQLHSISPNSFRLADEAGNVHPPRLPRFEKTPHAHAKMHEADYDRTWYFVFLLHES